MGDWFSNWKADFLAWLAAPTKADMTPLHIFYITGLYVIFVVLWIIFLNHIIRALKAGA
jgi:hypothetical protein